MIASTLLALLGPLLALPPQLEDLQLEGEVVGELDEAPFGTANPRLDSAATGRWWERIPKLPKRQRAFVEAAGLAEPHEQSVAFALYTTEAGVLKLTAQLWPQRPGAPTAVRLELREEDGWREAARTRLVYPGWSAHFRLEDWDASRDVAYRVRHGESGLFEGRIRRDPVDAEVVRVAVMSCNGTYDLSVNPHERTLANLRAIDPDLLFFAGDQHYQHTQHTAGWIAFGTAFADVLRDRPTVTIPDDHDVGHPNLWGEAGGKSEHPGGADGGYRYPPLYVQLVERQQCWHLPDAFDPTPLESGIGVYYTRLRVGEVDFAILEDRKFKTGPMGTIPEMGPRPDHIVDPEYDPKSIDLPGLVLLGERQLRFLDQWAGDWRGVRMKAALSQTAFCGAVHLHGQPDNFLLADLDCNGWPQSGRRRALRLLRAARAVHLCGDQHLAVVVKHGVDEAHEGPYAFTGPALYNSIYGRWWRPADGQPGENPLADSPLAWTGNFRDGLGNPLRMLAYANPSFERKRPLEERADGFGLASFDKRTESITFHCWSRYADVLVDPPFSGWPLTVRAEDNDAREPRGWMPRIELDAPGAVVELRRGDGELVYARRIEGTRFDPPAFAAGEHVLRIGRERPERECFRGEPGERGASTLRVKGL